MAALNFRCLGKSPISNYDAELLSTLRTKDDTPEDLWKRMGEKEFYEIRLYDSFLNKSLSMYYSRDQFDRKLREILSRKD